MMQSIRSRRSAFPIFSLLVAKWLLLFGLKEMWPTFLPALCMKKIGEYHVINLLYSSKHNFHIRPKLYR